MLRGKKVLVVGASGAIGSAVALHCAEKHAHLVLAYNHSRAKVAMIADRIKSTGGTASLLAVNVADEQKMVRTFEDNKSQMEDLYGLVNCSGINLAGPLISLSSESIKQQILINLTGAIHLTQQVLKIMVRRRTGSVVHIGSVSAHRVVKGHSVYSAAKAGLEGFTRALASEVARRNVRINCVLPGPVMSDMLKQSIDQTGDQPEDRVPMRRMINAEEVAKTVGFLLSDESSATTGAMIPVDGGYLLW